MKTLTFKKPYPKQQQFLLARSRYIAYGGARGGGKSHVARMKAELLCLRYAGIQVLFMRRTYPELKSNHLMPAIRELKDVAKYNGTDKAFLFPNGGVYSFRSTFNIAEIWLLPKRNGRAAVSGSCVRCDFPRRMYAFHREDFSDHDREQPLFRSDARVLQATNVSDLQPRRRWACLVQTAVY